MNKRAGHAMRWLVGVVVALMLASCGFPGMVSTSQQLPRVSQAEPTPGLPPVRFPEDEGMHNNLTEWWYYTGHLDATEGGGKEHRYGFELVVFQVLRSDLPPIYAAHFAISDITRGEFHYDQRREMEPRIHPGEGGTKGIDVGVGDWSIQGVNGRDHMMASMKDYAIRLDLVDRKGPVLHNGNGLITYKAIGFSYYYSRTRMGVSGTIVDHGQVLRVSGQAWMDHQWGDFLLPKGAGWDWYSIQLNDDTEMMLYFIRDTTGRVVSTYIEYIDERTQVHTIAPSALRATVLDKWVSPKTRITYPSGWRLDIKDPHLRMELTVTPQLKGQELVARQATESTYWEGAVNVRGQAGGKVIEGVGYVELTEYVR